MATFKTKLSFRQAELPKLISLVTQRWLSSSHGFLSGKARSKRKMKKETSTRNPTPAPTATSFRNLDATNGVPVSDGFDLSNHTFPASTNKAPLK